MTPKLQSAEYIRGYTIRLRFADGSTGDVDLQGELWGEVFEPLKDVEVFRRFRLDTDLDTLTWPSGADLAPEFLYEKVASQQASSTDATSSRR
ncbi:MAG: DUF2442 domain-containing protein [Planctomycetota bacterium]|nr:MAG: DUF2442 domain-containing protein [Planctomycetota bacterium]